MVDKSFAGRISVLQSVPVAIVPVGLAMSQAGRPFVAIVRSRAEFWRWLEHPVSGLEWLQVEQLLPDADAWMPATRAASQVAIDVILSDPSEFSNLYRLVDVSAVRPVRVTIPVLPGFLKGLKLAASLQLAVRILPGQPTAELVTELEEALEFYLHAPAVEAPVEFYHSFLSSACGADTGSLWTILEEDPALFQQYDTEGIPVLPRSSQVPLMSTSFRTFVGRHFKDLLQQGSECVTCPWRQVCRGYFKWPDPGYSCKGIKQLFHAIDVAATEIKQELTDAEGQLVEG